MRLLYHAADAANVGERRGPGGVPGSGRSDGRLADTERLAERHHGSGHRRRAGIATSGSSVGRPGSAGNVAASDRVRVLLRRHAAGPAGVAVDHDHQRAGRRSGLELRRRGRDRSDHLAGADRLRRLVLRRDPSAGRRRAEHSDRGREPGASNATATAPANPSPPNPTSDPAGPAQQTGAVAGQSTATTSASPPVDGPPTAMTPPAPRVPLFRAVGSVGRSMPAWIAPVVTATHVRQATVRILLAGAVAVHLSGGAIARPQARRSLHSSARGHGSRPVPVAEALAAEPARVR